MWFLLRSWRSGSSGMSATATGLGRLGSGGMGRRLEEEHGQLGAGRAEVP